MLFIKVYKGFIFNGWTLYTACIHLCVIGCIILKIWVGWLFAKAANQIQSNKHERGKRGMPLHELIDPSSLTTMSLRPLRSLAPSTLLKKATSRSNVVARGVVSRHASSLAPGWAPSVSFASSSRLTVSTIQRSTPRLCKLQISETGLWI